jgi:hypothetical protein
MSEQEIDAEVGRRLRARKERLERFTAVNSRLMDVAGKFAAASNALRNLGPGYEREPDVAAALDISLALDVSADSVKALLLERETLRVQLLLDRDFLRTYGL